MAKKSIFSKSGPAPKQGAWDKAKLSHKGTMKQTALNQAFVDGNVNRKEKWPNEVRGMPGARVIKKTPQPANGKKGK